MGKLVEQSIKTMYQGVSRQPDPVRLPGQVEEADNILVSIVTGGIENRPASRYITDISYIQPTDTPAIYAYSRDTLERYMIIVNDGDLKVYDLDGVEKTVNFPDGKSYLASTNEKDDFSFVTIADFTIIANATVTTAMLPNNYTQSPRALVNCRTTNTNSNYQIQISTNAGASWGTYYNQTFTAAKSNTQLADDVMANLSLPAGFTKTRLGETIIITGNTDFQIRHNGSDATYGFWTMTDTVPQREYLPAKAPDGYYIRVGQNIDGDQYGYWAEYSSDEGGWVESVNPYEENAYDTSTMPHFLVREANGTFTFRQGDYPDRIAGDNDIVPPPDFVGGVISALAFHRNRLAFVSGENISFSQSGKYFTFWPDFSTQTLDSDSFGLTASSETVNDLRHAVGFRKALFLTSNKAQFEVSGGAVLTPKSATVDLATSYLTEEKCKPITLGNKLYFAAKSGRDAIVFEYTYSDEQVSNVASDITLHALGYIPAPIERMAGDPTNDMLMLLTEEEPNALYIYKMYSDGGAKAQSAWARWTYGTNSKIKWMEVIDGELYMVLSRNGTVFFEKTFLRYELSQDKHPYQLAMDRQVSVTGVYDVTTNLTTWTTPYHHQNASSIVLSTDFPVGQVGEVLTLQYPSNNTITAVGNYSGGDALIGEVFTSSVTLSNLYPRDPNNLRIAITSGRFQLRNIGFNFKTTGFFKVEITPEFRQPVTFQFTGRVVGSGTSKVGVAPVEELGQFRVPVRANSTKVKIRIYNDTEKPFNITSIDYVGYFNEITRQG